MNLFTVKPNQASGKRRYLVHLFCVHDENGSPCRYTARIRIWTSRSVRAKTNERVFGDEYELIEIVNPLLPSGSDVRNVFSHIENPDGFFYLLYLSFEEAGRLGWRG
jgi:hypothetical protein